MPQFHLPTLEADILEQWDKNRIFDQIIARNDDPKRPRFVFFEGPPGANGKPGIHHVLSRVTKDVILRFRTMQGYRIDRKAGWDTHGLPVELAVEKKLGFKAKSDIETYGIAAFNAECKATVFEYLEEWNKLTKRVGVWLDLDNPYITYENNFIESLWHIFGEFQKKDLLYKGFRITPHCPRCVTSLSSHELALGYKDTEDPSVYVKFPVKGAENTFFLVWTTTPWTLPANVALAMGQDVTYVRAKMRDTGEIYVLAKERLEVLKGEYDLEREALGRELVGSAYDPLFATMPKGEWGAPKAYKVYAADFVSTGDGTGIVHIAPAFGEDDYALGHREGLPTLFSVDNTGAIIMDVPGKGTFFKEADVALTQDLTDRGLLYSAGKTTHSYPFCWRCSTPILYFAKSSWYIRMSSLRDKLLENNNKINWFPPHVQNGRFGEWLKDVKDWAISRERYWGTPLPIWQCGSCETTRVVGSFAELEQGAPAKNTFFVMRHGEGEHNVAEIVSSWPEPEKPHHLTEKGRVQALETAQKLKDKGIDMIVASDYTRTRETAEIVARELGLEVSYDIRLRELYCGDLNGKTITEYHEYFGDTKKRFDTPAPNGETLHDARKRMVEVVKELNAEHSGKKILLISHGDPIWMLISGFAGVTDDAAAQSHYNATGEAFEMPALANLPYDAQGHVDPHRPFIDAVTLVCENCQGTMRRVPDVADVWFDSGAMPFAQWHYPFENKERIDENFNFPADFIAEGVDQTRGWFYTLLAVTTALGYEHPPFKNVICHGLVLDKTGKKMSKSKGNVVDPWMVAEKYGIDAIRYFFYSANQPYDDKLFDEKALEDITKKLFLILWNVLSFYGMYADGRAIQTSVPRVADPLDQWILALLEEFREKTTVALENYDIVTASRGVGAFVNELSTWYVRRSRDRFKNEKNEECVATLGYVLHTLAHIMAPMTPFVADAFYHALGGEKESIHLAEWPETGAKNEKILLDMEHVRIASSLGLEQRAKSGIAIRQALGSATVHASAEFSDWMRDILADELNVHTVTWEKKTTGMEVVLDTTITPELRREGAARECVRNINDLRKASGLTPADRIIVCVATDSEFWKKVLDEHGDGVLGEVRGEAFETGCKPGETERAINSEEGQIAFGIRKL